MTPLPQKLKELAEREAKLTNDLYNEQSFIRGVTWLYDHLVKTASELVPQNEAAFVAKCVSEFDEDLAYENIGEELERELEQSSGENIRSLKTMRCSDFVKDKIDCFIAGAKWQHSISSVREAALVAKCEEQSAEISRLHLRIGQLKICCDDQERY